MSFKHSFQPSIGTPGGAVTGTKKEYTAEQELNLDIPVPGGSTDLNVTVGIDVSQIKSIMLLSARDMTIQANDGTTPDFTISLKAGIPYIWNTDSYDTLKLTADVTNLFLTLAAGDDDVLKLRALLDPTL